MQVRALILDHDDTVVNSTATVHWPCFCEYMRKVRPHIAGMGLDEYFLKNFDPGVLALFRDICGMTEEEMRLEQEYWHAYVQRHVPQAYPGMRELLERYRSRGGKICVVSHSLSANILRDYRANGLPEPDAVFGWECPPQERKPSPVPVRKILRLFGLSPREALVVDDLKPGCDMAAAAGVPFAAARWSNDIAPIDDFMRRSTPLFFKTVEEMARYVLS